MKNFVVGVVFDLNLQNMLLIKKNRPAHMAGLFNGIGGHVEEGETFDEAMEREAEEEAGLSGLLWKRGPKIEGTVPKIEGTGYRVRFYYAVLPGPIVYQQKTDEELYVVKLDSTPDDQWDETTLQWQNSVVEPLTWVIDCLHQAAKEAQNALASGNEDV